MMLYIQSSRPPAVDISSETLFVGDVKRGFRIVVPQRLSKPSPVVFAFHGIGDSADSMAAYSGLDRLAVDNGFLLIYPSGINAMWATIDVQPETVDTNRDVQFFDALLKHAAAKYDIDRDRVYLIGMSNGASFAQLLAYARSSNIAAVVSHSGPRPRSFIDCERPFPILLIVGSEDFAASSIRSDLEHYRSSGHDAELIVVDRLGHGWSMRHNRDAWEFLAKRRQIR